MPSILLSSSLCPGWVAHLVEASSQATKGCPLDNPYLGCGSFPWWGCSGGNQPMFLSPSKIDGNRSLGEIRKNKPALFLFQKIPVKSRDNYPRPTHSITRACAVMTNLAIDKSIVYISDFVLGGATIAHRVMLLTCIITCAPSKQAYLYHYCNYSCRPFEGLAVLCR